MIYIEFEDTDHYSFVRLVCGNDIPSKNVSVCGRTRDVRSKGKRTRLSTPVQHFSHLVMITQRGGRGLHKSARRALTSRVKSDWTVDHLKIHFTQFEIFARRASHFSSAPRYGN